MHAETFGFAGARRAIEAAEVARQRLFDGGRRRRQRIGGGDMHGDLAAKALERVGVAGGFKRDDDADEPDLESADASLNSIAKKAGVKVKIIPTETFFPHMAQAIAASDDIIKQKPEMIRKVVHAALRGMKDIMDDPNKAADDFVSFVPEWKGKEGAIKATFNYYATLVYPGQPQLGEVNVERLRNLPGSEVLDDLFPGRRPAPARSASCRRRRRDNCRRRAPECRHSIPFAAAAVRRWRHRVRRAVSADAR